MCNIEDQHIQDAFFTDASIFGDFKDYVSNLLNHVNPLTGLGKFTICNFLMTIFLLLQHTKMIQQFLLGRLAMNSITQPLPGL